METARFHLRHPLPQMYDPIEFSHKFHASIFACTAEISYLFIYP